MQIHLVAMFLRHTSASTSVQRRWLVFLFKWKTFLYSDWRFELECLHGMWLLGLGLSCHNRWFNLMCCVKCAKVVYSTTVLTYNCEVFYLNISIFLLLPLHYVYFSILVFFNQQSEANRRSIWSISFIRVIFILFGLFCFDKSHLNYPQNSLRTVFIVGIGVVGHFFNSVKQKFQSFSLVWSRTVLDNDVIAISSERLMMPLNASHLSNEVEERV